MLTTSDYGKNIQVNINAVVEYGKFNQAIVRRALDQKNKGVFESPAPLSVTFKDGKKNWYSESNNWKFIKSSQCKLKKSCKGKTASWSSKRWRTSA